MLLDPDTSENRRPIASRNLAVIQQYARWLINTGITPNAISVSSMMFATMAGGCLLLTSSANDSIRLLTGLGAAVCIQLRLLANLFDGMVAVEGGKASPLGDIFNEAPDRVSDTLILVGAGFAAGSNPFVGAIAAVMALMTAYVRALGVSVGAGQVFAGPMAKPQRMFLLTLGSLYVGIAPSAALTFEIEQVNVGVFACLLTLVAFLSAVTSWRRIRKVCSYLTSKAESS